MATESKLVARTTQEHYDKYARLSEHVPTGLAPYSKDVEKLRELFLADEHLNNIPLRNFDAMVYSVRQYAGKGLSIAESCCILKHILIYRVLGAEFESK